MLTQEEIDQIESTFSLKLPARYQHFLRQCDFPEADSDILLTPSELIETNQDVRSNEDWNDCYFVIGGDGCGNFFCVDVTGKSEAIWIWEHDPPEGFQIAFSHMEELFKAYGA